ncbi:MAG TPA: MFS transporter [Roseiflexaceae bacterium]|nr:MFS transporter [Roseiflexaceae bacterium]HMP40073.1 MFS transporter [Roseiflexaceae bacterium]
MKRFHYAWVVVAMTALTLLISAGVRSAPGVLLHPFELEFGWSRGEISLAVSIGLVLFGLIGPLTGALIDRHGPRLLMIIGLTVVAASMAAGAVMTQLWQLNLFWGALSGIGTGIVASVLGATVATRWFVARRGLVVGIFGASTSAGQLVFIPLLMGMVVTTGWRSSAWLLAAAAALLLLPIIMLMRNDPADVGLAPYGAAPGTVPAAPSRPPGGVMRRAVQTPEFWLLAGTFFICGATSNGLIGTHLIPHAIDHGIAEVTAAGVLALMGTMNFIGTITSGWLTDRYNPRILLGFYYGFRGLSLLLLPFVTDPAGLAFFAVLFGLDYIATVPPTTALVADTFGRRNVGTVFGWVFCAHQFGAAWAAWMGGIARDTLGNYLIAFLVASLLAIAAAGLSLRIRRPTAATAGM